MPDYRIAAEMARIEENIGDEENVTERLFNDVVTAFEEAGKDAIEIDVCRKSCQHCGGDNIRSAQAAGKAFLGVALISRIFNADSEEYAAQVFQTEVDDVYPDANIEIVYIGEMEDDAEVEA